MSTMRIIHESSGFSHSVRVEISTRSDFNNLIENRFEFPISKQQRELIRWYFEDFPHFPESPAPRIALNAENILQNWGKQLYQHVFGELKQTKLQALEEQWPKTRIEIHESETAECNLPWEWMSPSDGAPLGILAKEFVYARLIKNNKEIGPGLPLLFSLKNPMRVLFVTSRPLGDPISHRAVATQLLYRLDQIQKDSISIIMVRPPTLDQLYKTLAQARKDGVPFHVVHFDGHGILKDPMAKYTGRIMNPQFFLKFEDQERKEKLVSAKELADVLVSNDVAALVLNACRSGSPVQYPKSQLSEEAKKLVTSLSLETIVFGVPIVVAMRYNVLSATAAEFVADLYTSAALGGSLSLSTALARRSMARSPFQKRGNTDIHYQDWAIPVIYQLVVERPLPPALEIREENVITEELQISPKLPTKNFVGRENILLEIDRFFDSVSTVILFGTAGCGKSALAQEFARWYQKTGGVRSTQTCSLESIHNISANEQVGHTLWVIDDNNSGLDLESGSFWKALINENRSWPKILLVVRGAVNPQLAKIIPNISADGMNRVDQEELLEGFLRMHGIKDRSTSGWHRLIEYAQGNPAALELSVEIACANSSPTPELAGHLNLEFFQGASPFTYPMVPEKWQQWKEDLIIAIERHFSPEERRRLSLLAQFRTTVTLRALHLIGKGIQDDWEKAIKEPYTKDLVSLLQRAEQVGLLSMRSPGVYFLPPLSHAVLDHFFPKELRHKDGVLTFAIAIGIVTGELVAGVIDGHVEARSHLIMEQPNILCALNLARSMDCWQAAFNLVQTLLSAYQSFGVKQWFLQLFRQSLPIFEDEEGWPLPDRIAEWSAISQYWGYAAECTSNWDEAERALARRVEVLKKEAEPILGKKMQDLSPKEINEKQRLVVAVEHLGTAQRHQKKHECIATYNTAISLLNECTDPDEDERIHREAGLLLNLATAFMEDNLEKASDYATKGLNKIPIHDKLLRAQAFSLIGQIEYLKGKKGDQEAMRRAKKQFELAVGHYPASHMDELLNTKYFWALAELQLKNYDQSIKVLREILTHYDKRNDPSLAAEIRYNIAVALGKKGSFAHAMEYIEAAISGYERSGAGPSIVNECLKIKTQLNHLISDQKEN